MQLAYLMVVVTMVLIPGPDMFMTIRNAAVGGRRTGFATLVGIGAGACTQAVLVSVGVGAVIVRIQPLFQAIKWAGIAYLLYIGVRALWAARRGDYTEQPLAAEANARRAFRQGLLCNLTNPKVILFYLALLPQFVPAHAPLVSWLGHALLLPLLGTVYLGLIATSIALVRRWLLRSRVRRALDAVSGLVFVGFGLKLATER